jgi:antirestriction protein ArdC
MPRSSPHVSAGAGRTSLYQEITTRIIDELEAGRLTWVQPWGTSAVEAPLAMPRNATTGRRYSGINVLILWGAVVQQGYSGQSWLTFRQALALGGHVRKGERGTTVVFAHRFTPDAERDRAREQGDDPRTIPFLKRFTVFNTDQCDGLPDEVATMAPPPPEGMILPEVEALIRRSGADLRIGGERVAWLGTPRRFAGTIFRMADAEAVTGRWATFATRPAGRCSSGSAGRNPVPGAPGIGPMPPRPNTATCST